MMLWIVAPWQAPRDSREQWQGCRNGGEGKGTALEAWNGSGGMGMVFDMWRQVNSSKSITSYDNDWRWS